MLKFEYKINEKYIYWKAQWDGRHDNEPLISEEERDNQDIVFHPLRETIDYVDGKDSYDFFKKNADSDGTFRRNQGLFNTELSPEKIEEMNPENLREAGDVVAKNPVTLTMCNLLSDPQNIHKHSGNVHRYWYYCQLLGCLSRLWD